MSEWNIKDGNMSQCGKFKHFLLEVDDLSMKTKREVLKIVEDVMKQERINDEITCVRALIVIEGYTKLSEVKDPSRRGE